jgi:hypothetical protein
MAKKPVGRGKKGKTSRTAGKFHVDFGVVSQHRHAPILDGMRIKAGPGGIDLTRKQGLAKRLALDGYSDEVIARIAGVSLETLDYWKAVHGDLADAIKSGRTAADAEVVATLHMLATGFEREEETVAGKDAVRVTYRKYHAPELGAIKTWLNARVPQFREVQRMEATGKNGKPLIPKESRADLISSIVSLVKPKPDK